MISLPYLLSMARPMKTSTAPNHCFDDIGLLKMITEPSMVKNFRVVVMIEHFSGPNDVMVVKIKCLKD